MRHTDRHKTYNLRLSGDGTDSLEHSIRCGCSVRGHRVLERDFLISQYALVYVAEGEGVYGDSQGGLWPLRAGSLFQRFPEIPHTVRFHGPHRQYYLAVPPQIYGLLQKVDSPFIRQPVHFPGADGGAEEIYRKLLDRFDKRDESEYFSLLIEMQSAVDRLIKLNGRQLTGVAGKLERAAELLRNSLEPELSLEETARMIDMGYHHFRKSFSRRFGQPPGQYRIAKRVEAAMALLLTPGYTVTRTARELGYSDVYAFSAQFRKVSGMPPGRYARSQ